MPYLRTLSSFRDGVRQLAMQKSETALKDILALCDKLRDIDLVPLELPWMIKRVSAFFFSLYLMLIFNASLCRWEGSSQTGSAGGLN